MSVSLLIRATTCVAAALLATAAAAVEPPNPKDLTQGVWELDLAKSKFCKPKPRSGRREILDTGWGLIAVHWTGADAAGKPIDVRYVWRYDGEKYPATIMEPANEAISWKLVNPSRVEFVHWSKDNKKTEELHAVQWNLTMAATVIVMAPVIVAVLLRPEGVRRGRHADGGEGMKVAVIGGRLDLHAGARVRPRARARPAGHRRARAARHRRASGATWSARWPRRMLERARLRRRARDHRRPRPRASTAPTSCSSRSASAARRRGCRTRPCRCRAAASGRRRPAPAGFAKALRTVPVVLEIAERVRERAAPGAWIVDFTNPVGIVTRALLDAGHRAVGLCNVAIGFQRPLRAHARRRARRASWSTRSGSTTSRGSARSRLDGDDVLAELLADHGDAARRRGRAAAPAARRARRDPVVLPALLLRARRGARPSSATGVPRAARRSPRSSASCSSSTATRRWTRSRRCSSSAAARSTARPRPGSSRRCVADDGDVHVVDMRNDGTLAGPAPTTTSSRCRRASARDGPVPLRAGAARAGAARARRSTSPPTSGSPSEAALSRRPRRPPARRCSRTR